MHTHSPRVDATKILTRRELQAVLADLRLQSPHSRHARLNLILVRLACCCGLRVSEIAGLQVADVRTEVSRPHLRIRRGASKGKRPRMVPLWWDAGTLEDLRAWKDTRLKQGAKPDDPIVACLQAKRSDTPLSRHTLRKRFQTACKVLGLDRLATLTIHHGLHTVDSHALAGHRAIASLRPHAEPLV